MSEEFTQARAKTLEALSRIFAGDIDLLVELREDEEGLRSLSESLSVDPDPLLTEATETELRRSYDALFAIPGKRYVPPFASSHLTEPPEDAPPSPSAFARADGGRLGGEPAQRSRAVYSRFGFSPSRGEGMPDHLAAQLEFAARVDATVPEGDRAREDAFTLLGWLDAFERKVRQRDDLGVFTGVVSLAAATISQDRIDDGE